MSSSRPGRERYVPPGLRCRQEELGEAHAELRSLDGSVPVLQVELRVEAAGALPSAQDLEACPAEVEELAAEGEEGSGEPSPGPRGWKLSLLDAHPEDLAGWLHATFPAGDATLLFPPSLSKQERARWHRAAEWMGLPTQSVGQGQHRFLTVGQPLSAGPAPAGALGDGRQRLTQEQRARAMRIYDFCQMEGGRWWDMSVGEVQELVAAGAPLPADLQEVVDKREEGERVFELLRARRPSAALDILSRHPELAWHRDLRSGGYPLHLAAWHGYTTLAHFLAALDGTVSQRDGRRDTPLALAARRGHGEVEALLLQAGAAPAAASYLPEPSPRRRPPPPPLQQQAGAAGGGGSPGAGDGRMGVAGGEDEEYSSWDSKHRADYRRGGRGGRGRGGRARGRGRPEPTVEPSGW